jgi:hypothetical protein
MKRVAIVWSSTWKRVLIVLTMAGLLTAVVATPANAYEERGRHCKTYYHLADPSTGWGFTVCVKLEKSGLWWRANGSVTTTTPGMVLHTADTYFFASDQTAGGVGGEDIASKGPAATQILGITTHWFLCNSDDTYEFYALVHEWVTWPNGATSPTTTTYTTGNMNPSSPWWLALCV